MMTSRSISALSFFVSRPLPLTAIVCSAILALACDAGQTSDEDDPDGTPPSSPSPNTGGTPGAAGSPGQAGSTGNPPPSGPSSFGTPVQEGQGQTAERYFKSDVKRDGVNYFFMANGWGPKFGSHQLSYNGTSFTVVNMTGDQGPMWEPATYPTVFCGVYSDSRSKECGLPLAISSVTTLKTGWSWKPNGNTGQYNAAYDVWLGTGDTINTHSAFLMVWLRDPPGQQPAGSRTASNITVANTPGNWDLWTGNVGGKPCISYVRSEGQDSYVLEFDVMDFVRDVSARSINMPGSTILSVAVGFEIWKGPVTNLVSEDFYVKVN